MGSGNGEQGSASSDRAPTEAPASGGGSGSGSSGSGSGPGKTPRVRAEEPGPPLGTEIAGRHRYRLEQRLGRGEFGSVYLATCLDAAEGDPQAPPPEVAVKVLSRPRGDWRQFLKRELAALLSIECDRIPRVYDWRVDGDCAFVALRYFPRGSLADLWASTGRMSELQVWQLLHDLLTALDAAHRASVLHLDIKPSNVLLDGESRYVLTDFGVAQASRMSQGLMARVGMSSALGTHGYRAPEQDRCELDSFDIRTDLWGAGATAWAAYTGIDLTKRRDALRRKESGNVFGLMPLSEVRLHCPRDLEDVVMRLLHIDPARRPGGAGEVLALVEAGVRGANVDAALGSEPSPVSAEEIEGLLDSLVDPLWSSVLRSADLGSALVRFDDGDVLGAGGERAYRTYLLLRGRVQIERDGNVVDTEEHEGTFLGAVSTLSGAPSSATMRADGPVFACVFNEAQLEHFVTGNPAVAVRMLRSLARRLAAAAPRRPER